MSLIATFTADGKTETFYKSITLQGMPQPSQTLELHPGWNIVTLTKPLKDSLDGLQKFLWLKPIMFDAENSSLVVCDSADAVKAGIGYWVFSRSRQTIELVQDTEQPVSQVELKQGWNFVGMTEESTWPDAASVIWTWQNGRFVPVEKAELQVGYSYWVYLF